MKNSLFYKMFGSVRLVQEVTRSNSSTTTNTTTPNSTEESIVIEETSVPNDSSDLTSNNVQQNDNLPEEITVINEKSKDNNIIKQDTKHKQEQQQHIYIHQQQPASSSQQQQQQQASPCWQTTTQNIPITFSAITSPNLLSSYKYRDFRNFFTASNTNTNATNPSPVKTHTKKNSKYTVRHHRTHQSSFNGSTNPPAYFCSSSILRKQHPSSPTHHNFLQLQEERQKSKSQKLLCLWPLPIVTRYMILVALFVSTLNCLHILNLSCSAPSFVIYRLDIKNMIFSPFLFDWTLPSLALFGWNVLILGLFEESLAHMLGGTKRFVQLWVFLFATVSLVRVSLGLIFSKGTGYAFPSLFFSNTMHECSQGL
jgi:hypothetical protein